MKDRAFIEFILAHVSLAAAELPPEGDQYADEEHRMLYSEIMFLMRLCNEYINDEIEADNPKTVEELTEQFGDLRFAQSEGLLRRPFETASGVSKHARKWEGREADLSDIDIPIQLGDNMIEIDTSAAPFDVAGVDVAPPDAVPDPTATKATRFNNGKPELSYVMSTGPALDGVARIMEFGAKKYARDNWKKGLEPDSILDSLLRHVAKYLNGEYLDLNKYGEADKDHSGLPHVDHIACNALFLGYHTNRHTGDGRLVDEE